MTQPLPVSKHRTIGVGLLLILVALSLALLSPAKAQTIRDGVRSQLADGLEQQEQKPKQSVRQAEANKRKRPANNRPSNRDKPAPGPRTGQTLDLFGSEPQAAEKDPLPHRVIGDWLKFDPKVGVGYRGWLAQDYPQVSVPHTGYFTWTLELRARLFKYINLRRGYYESNGLSAPRNQDFATASKVGKFAPKAAWLLGVLGVDISPAWQPIISYETRAFESEANPSVPVCVVPHDTPANPTPQLADCERSSEPLRVVSGFETFVAGIRYDHSRTGSSVIGAAPARIPAFYLGFGYTNYAKPYQVTVGDEVFDDAIFDARFRGLGLAFGLDTPSRPERLYVDVSGQTGFGTVNLLDDWTLNKDLPAHWMIGYLQGTVTLGYLYPLLRTRPTVFLSGAASGGGMTFFFFKTKASEGERMDGPTLNWDFLWDARLAMIIPL